MQSDQLGIADMMNMMQIVLMRMEEMQISLKESQMENQNMEKMQNKMQSRLEG